MMTHPTRCSRCLSRLTLLSLASLLILGTVGCSRAPRKHWWEFWRPKAADATYKPDTQILPPPPEALGPGGSSSALSPDGQLPPPPGGGESLAEPDPLRRAAQATSQLQTVYFDFDSAELNQDAVSVLDNNAAWLQANPSYTIQIEGHSDERGTIEYNLNLGDQRAKAVKEYLMSKGIPGNRLHTISYGEERPQNPARTEEAWAQNRRAQFLVY